MNTTICIPVHTTNHPMLQDCVKNIRETTGLEPLVWETKENVAVARRDATEAVDTEYILFVDTDAFPVQKDWHLMMESVANKSGCDIVSPNEVLVFDDGSRTPVSKNKNPYGMKVTSNVAGMCVLVRKGVGIWDTNIGLTSGFLVPCIEDTDFAISVETHWVHPSVTVLHKDRGAINMDDWTNTHEFLCYELMGYFLGLKWKYKIPDFLSGLGKVPAKDQRFLADGYTVDDLIECYNPIISKLPADIQANTTASVIQTVDEYKTRMSWSRKYALIDNRPFTLSEQNYHEKDT